MNKLAEWTNTWFIRPSTCERPSANENLWVFMALVSLIGPEMQEKDLRYVHAYFTYLLLGCDPVTDTIFDKDIDQDWRRVFERLLDFTHPRDPVPRWNLLLRYSKLDPQFLVRQVSDKLAIQRAYLTMTFVLLRRPVIPDTLLFVKMCLDLYHRHLDYEYSKSALSEFKLSGPLFLAVWIRNAIDQAFRIGTMSIERTLSMISYMAWFANLVRSERTLLADNDQRPETFGVIDSILRQQVEDLKKILDSAPLKVEEIIPSTHLLDVLGIRPKKKVK